MYSLKELFERRNDKTFGDKVTAACWRYAKSLIAKPEPTIQEMRLAEKLISDGGCGKEIGKFQIAATVLLDDAMRTADDETIQNTVETIGTKLINLQY